MDAQPHDAPVEILPDVFFVHGSIRMGPGMRINRNMVVVRNAGELTLIDPIRLTDEGEEALERLGSVKHAIRLGVFHGVDDAYTVERFGARFWCQAGSDEHPEPKPDEILEEGMDLPFPDAELFVFREAARPECAILLRRDGGLLVTCDSVQHWESTSRCTLAAKAVTHLMGFVHPANIPPPWRKFMAAEGRSLRLDFDRLLELPFDSVVGGHGQPLIGGARDALRTTVTRIFG
jgi:hypothetical protein